MVNALQKIIQGLAGPRMDPVLLLLRNMIEALNSPLPRKLVIIPHNGGFFSNFNKVMNHLVCSLHHYGIRGIEVDWQIDRKRKLNEFSYGRPEDGNIWEYFFEPLSFPHYSFIRRVKRCAFNDASISHHNAHKLYQLGGEWRQRYHAAFKKHIRIRPSIQQKVDRLYSETMADRYCIGVHIRNEAHRIEGPNHEMPPIENYVAETKQILQSKKDEAVLFLATDVEEYSERFKDIFHGKVVVQPGVKRLLEHPSGDLNQQLHHCHANASLKLGEDILIDCLLLSRCDVFIHTVSNVATAVGYINPTITMIYCES